MIIPAFMVLVSCGGKRKSCHLEFEFVFWKPESPHTVVGHIVTGDHFRTPGHVWDVSQCSAPRGQLKEDKFLPRYDTASAANGKNVSPNSEGRLHVVRKGSP